MATNIKEFYLAPPQLYLAPHVTNIFTIITSYLKVTKFLKKPRFLLHFFEVPTEYLQVSVFLLSLCIYTSNFTFIPKIYAFFKCLVKSKTLLAVLRTFFKNCGILCVFTKIYEISGKNAYIHTRNFKNIGKNTYRIPKFSKMLVNASS